MWLRCVCEILGVMSKRWIIGICLIALIIISIIGADRMAKARGSANYGSALLILQHGIDSINEYKHKNNMLPFLSQKLSDIYTNINNEDSAGQLKMLHSENTDSNIVENCVVLLWDVPIVNKNKRYKYVASLSGHIYAVPENQALLGSIVDTNSESIIYRK